MTPAAPDRLRTHASFLPETSSAAPPAFGTSTKLSRSVGIERRS